MDEYFNYHEWTEGADRYHKPAYQEEIIDSCMHNSYDVITGNKTIDELIDENETPYFLWNVVAGDIAIIDVLDCMIDYFEDLEDYEKCAKLLKLKKDGEIKCRRKIKRINKIRKRGL